MNDDSLNLLKRAVQCRDTGNYGKAQEYLDNLIEADPENHLLWYEKSKLPIVQEDNVTIKNRVVSLSVYQRLPLPDKNSYLQQCGFEITEVPEIESYMRVPNLLADQRVKYLQMAIRYAPENEKAVYMAELGVIADFTVERTRKDTRAATYTGFVALLVSVSTVFLLNTFYSTPFFQMPLNVVIVLIVPYALSVTGMVLYSKAKNNRNGTVIGFVFNLLALIISNLSIVNAIILFFTK